MKEKVMNGLEKFSKAMLSPLSYISAAGLILVLGALLTSTSLSAMIPVLQWTPIKLLGQLIYNCIMVIINNLSLMFCVGIAAALAKKNKQQAAIIGLMSYFMYLTAGNVTLTQLGMLAEADPMVGLYGTGQSTVFGIQTVDMGVFGGILLGYIWQILLNGVLANLQKPLLALDAKAGFVGLVILMCWQQIGYMMIIYVAGLQSVPGDLIEAAKIDGANDREILFKIKIPMVMPSVTICTFLTLTNSFKLFDQNVALTAGEPANASEMLALNIYNTFYGRSGAQWKGIGQAKAVVFFLLVIVIALIQLYFTRRKEVQQ